MLTFQDRNAIALARLNTIEKDLNLTGSQYQTCVSILFAGYVIVGIPANMVVTRVRPSIWMASCMTVWAIISGLTALSRNYTGLLLTRFFLGITEAPYYPGALYILARFYTRKELATRISILYTGNILATAFAGLIALGIFEMDGMVRRQPNHSTSTNIPGQPCRLAMALHHPRRSNPCHRNTRLLRPPRRAPHNTLVDRAGTPTSPRANPARHSRKCRRVNKLLWYSRSSEGPQGLAFRRHAALSSRCEWVQEFLPDCCEDAGVQSNYYPGFDVSALLDCGGDLHCVVLVFWTV